MRSHLLIVAALLVPFAIACSASSEDDGATGDDQNITGRPGELNGMCGGIAGLRCGSGLKCKLGGNHPDASGKCVADAAAPPPPMQCMAMPVCDPNDVGSVDACAATDGDSCYTRSMCGKTINCKKQVELEGTLQRTVGIGGENTGTSIKTSSATTELVLGSHASEFVDGRFAKVKGTKKTLIGVETHMRQAIEVKTLLVCPAPVTFNCQPPVDPGNTGLGEDRAWIQAKCEGVRYLD